jgi:hypothetical protein
MAKEADVIAVLNYEELRIKGLHVHMEMLNEDWNEPDDYLIGLSTVIDEDGLYTVTTSSRMRYLLDGSGDRYGDWFETVMVATYMVPHEAPISTVCINTDGTIGYVTGERKDR